MSVKDAMLSRLSPEARTSLSQRRAKVESALVRAASTSCSALLRALPVRVQGRIKQDLTPTTALDYRRAPIRLSVESEIEKTTRAISCRKEPETVDWIEQWIRPGDVVFDVGANVGAYSLVIDRATGGQCTVYAFEPVFSNFAQLNKNVLLNGAEGRVIPLNLALCDSTGVVPIAYSSLVPGTALHGLDGDGTSQPVLAMRIDDLPSVFALPSPNHLKIDVDGIEFAILRGAMSTLAGDAVKTILVEVEPSRPGSNDIETWLRERSFEAIARHQHGRDGPANVLFVRTPQ